MRYETIPRRSRFEDDTNAKNIFLAGKFNQDRMFKAILSLLRVYEQTDTLPLGDREFARLRAAGSLYFTTQNWLNDPQNRGRGRVAAIDALFEVTVRQLCTILDVVNPNAVANYLFETFGRAIGQGEFKADLDAKATFLDRDAAMQQRIHFRSGKAHTLSWWRPDRLRMVKANTADIPSPGVISAALAGYALTMDRALIMGRHSSTVEDAQGRPVPGSKFSHAAYAAGRPVLCAGEIGIVKGNVVAISNNSGHYKPKPEQLVSVLEYLRIVGIDLSKLLVQATCSAGNVFCWGANFLQNPSIEAQVPITGRELKAFFLGHWPDYYDHARLFFAAQGHARLSDQEIAHNLFS